jgi:hypothetical protein
MMVTKLGSVEEPEQEPWKVLQRTDDEDNAGANQAGTQARHVEKSWDRRSRARQ